jgi:hypothetical protein
MQADTFVTEAKYRIISVLVQVVSRNLFIGVQNERAAVVNEYHNGYCEDSSSSGNCLCADLSLEIFGNVFLTYF